ncbi:Ribonuclease H-like protein [Glarea lozoyensis ATCC 20868]|uniref:Ribonuclease H-like protein n=1 Tax=Glarea lozoyensis (strain ATCC 20868 / MF5171) TaxID=1116229 RepID=S3D0T9_GLAL2|nr:Ribonuclease H-like protein [Glarea lozoyensis ATCC 20868]EPE30764.1 Ribonuclease H-like protein [Glarea lozoyensis ATCC 20868]
MNAEFLINVENGPLVEMANRIPPDGVMREETFALRDLLGLYGQDLVFSADGTPSHVRSVIKDVLLLALDFEGEICSPAAPLGFRLGISVLDTRRLKDLAESQFRDGGADIQDAIRTCSFCTGPSMDCLKERRKEIFGNAREMKIEEMRTTIQALISGRHVVLVVHGGENDLRFLERLQIPIQPLYIIDTQKAAQNPLGLTARPSLETLLTILEIPHVPSILHVAGNDATYTLRSLLMIAVKDAEMAHGLDDKQQALVVILCKLAGSPLPESVKKQYANRGNGGEGQKRRREEKKAAKKLIREQLAEIQAVEASKY